MKLVFFYFLLIAYLLIGTGVASDDYIFMITMKGKGFLESIDPRNCLHVPAESIFFFMWFPHFRIDIFLLPEFLKMLYMMLCFYMAAKFFGLFIDRFKACLLSLLFIFFPSHDSTVYWLIGQYLAISISFYLYSYYLAERRLFLLSFLGAAIASFLSYGSIVMALPLSAMFFFRKKIKEGMVVLVPNVIYSVYYIYMTLCRANTGITARIPTHFDPMAFVKQLLLQIVTFIDAVLGPSMWMKIYYSFVQLSFLSIAIGLAGSYFILRMVIRMKAPRMDRRLLAGLSAMTGLSFIMFAVTGQYPQIAFNLGNRVTIFGSLLIVYLIFCAPVPRVVRSVICILLFFSILGISDHWKDWTSQQKRIFNNIGNNKKLQNFKGDLYVSGNQYSKFGPVSHVEFFAEGGADCAVNMILGNGVTIRPINGRSKYADGYLINAKHDNRSHIGEYIFVYDSTGDSVLKISKKDISDYIDSLPKDMRHWTQLPGFESFRKIAIMFMPRLRYAL